MGCGQSRATEASAYGVDATGRILDAPSAGRQKPACSRGEDACPHPEAPHPSGAPRRSVSTPRDDDVDGRLPRDVSSPDELRWRGSLAATHPPVSAASPPVPRRPNLPESTERFFDDRDAFTDLAASRSDPATATFSATFSSATSSSASSAARTHHASDAHPMKSSARSGQTIRTSSRSIAIDREPISRRSSDSDEREAYREVLAAAAAAVREAVDAVRVAAVPREETRSTLSVKENETGARDRDDRDESGFAAPASVSSSRSSGETRGESGEGANRASRATPSPPTPDGEEKKNEDDASRDDDAVSFVPGVGVTTSRRAPAAAVAAAAMDLVRGERKRTRTSVETTKSAVIRF